MMVNIGALSLVALILGVLILILGFYLEFKTQLLRSVLSDTYSLLATNQRSLDYIQIHIRSLLGQTSQYRIRRHRTRPNIFTINQRVNSTSSLPQIPAPIYATIPRSTEDIIPDISQQSSGYRLA
jgi:hypothetical protein